jgi:uncharacterized protein YqjF (DUF2071 family)
MSSMGASSSRERVFLSADWRDLVMLNYEVDPALLRSYIPRGTELDSFDSKMLVSLVGFRFLPTRLFGGVPIPFHSDFDEVNLRFYVRRGHEGEKRRGVVFIREIVPKRAIAYIARLVYGEKYSRLPMRHRISAIADRKTAEYEWRIGEDWCRLHAQFEGDPAVPVEGSLEQFITEHYWGYSAQRNGGSLEYRVDHVPWRVWGSIAAGIEGDAAALYGSALGAVLRGKPHSAFIAEGSPVAVFTGRPIS